MNQPTNPTNPTNQPDLRDPPDPRAPSPRDLARSGAARRGRAVTTYRYLRIGIVGVAFLLAVSVLIERSKVDCWQTSISAYYYTPVRAVLVGGLLAVGSSLIVLNGRTVWEDAALNASGMFAPVVAFAPTSGVGTCWSIEPEPPPVEPDGELAAWVTANIDNNIAALLIAGYTGLLVTALIVVAARRSLRALTTSGRRDTRLGLLATLVVLVVATLLFAFWGDFDTRAHGIAAVAMFGFLAVAVAFEAIARSGDRDRYFWSYVAIAAAMVLAAVIVFAIGTRWDHGVLVLEIVEIALFAGFWILQTIEHWGEGVAPAPP